MDIQGRQHGPERQKYSKVAHDQKSWKVQPKKRVVKRRSGEPSNIKRDIAKYQNRKDRYI